MPSILIVDDDPVIRNLLTQILEEFQESGVRLLTAESGEAAMESIKREKPDMIFLDVMMPKMNGFEVCDMVKRNPETKDIYIIMLTAKGQEIDKQKAKELGSDYYITKPFNMSELVVRISNLVLLRGKLRLKYNRFYALGAEKEISGSVDERFLDKVLEIINRNLRDFSFDVGNLIVYLGMSRTHLTRKLKILTGLTPGALIRNIRLEKAAELLLNKSCNVTEVANSVGISNPSSFTKSFRNYFGVSPKDYSKH